MSKNKWCIRCGKGIEFNDDTCHHCGYSQPKGHFNTEPSDLQVVHARYDHLVFKQSTEGLDDEEYMELNKLSEYKNEHRVK